MAGKHTESRRLAVGKGAALTGEAMDMAETFVKTLNLDEKTTLRMRLLSEEVIEMLKSMVDEFSGLFWLEADGEACRICIDGTADVDLAAEQKLISVSSDGKNASVKGFAAKLSQFVRHHKEYMEHLSGLMNLSGAINPEDYLYIGAMHPGYDINEVVWTMNDYRSYLFGDEFYNDDQVTADREELEKSIIGSIADDVQVGVKDDRIKITVIKKI